MDGHIHIGFATALALIPHLLIAGAVLRVLWIVLAKSNIPLLQKLGGAGNFVY